MNQAIQLIIDGAGAEPATAELRALPGLTITTAPMADSATPKGDPLTIIANIVTISSGLAVAELLRQWYHEWRQGKNNKSHLVTSHLVTSHLVISHLVIS